MNRIFKPFVSAGVLAGAVASVIGCRGAPVNSQDGEDVTRLVDSLRPAVEHAVGLRFTHAPVSSVRSREQVRAYLIHKLDAELPLGKARGLQEAYRLLGMFPDTVELRPLLLDLLTEQIVGFYDPDSSRLFVVSGADPAQLRVVVAHELVHALQHQYVRLDSIMHQTGDNDRLTAAQAVLEGQATLGGLQVMVPKQNLFSMPEFWETYREGVKAQQSSMPVFARAPRVIREELIFPYLAGADFMRWWLGSERKDTVPFGRYMPTSTEQILHPYRYGRNDQPLSVRFADSGPKALYEDVLGELDIRILLAELSGASEVNTPIAIGWGGDRYRLYESPGGAALLWVSVWDDIPSRFRFLNEAMGRLQARRKLGYRLEERSFELAGHPAVRLVIAPEAWHGWDSLPESRLINEAPPAGASMPAARH
ncbi:MAG: hypothetical protein ABJD11_01900 [Gemmatimonadota bacterium]